MLLGGNSFPNGMVLFDLHNNMACASYIDTDKTILYTDINLTDTQKKGKKRISQTGALYQVCLHLADIESFWLLVTTTIWFQCIFWLCLPIAFIFLPSIFGAVGAVGAVGSGWITRLIGGGVYFLISVLIYSLGMFIPSQNLRRFHGAEHKVINCYNSGWPLTVENIKIQSRISQYCTTGIGIYGWFFLAAAYICIPAVNPLIRLGLFAIAAPVAFLFASIVFNWMNRKKSPLRKIVLKPSLWMQRITTAEPAEDQILAGWCAVERLLMNQSGIYEIEEGFFAGNLFNGKGKRIFPNGGMYDGDWKNGRMSGYGIYRYICGDEYTGDFRYNGFHGNGKLTFANGNYYDGEWKHGKFYRGNYYFTSGEICPVPDGRF